MDIHIQKRLMSDKDIAAHLSISRSWVRRQRWLRKKGEPHFLTIDPIMVGTSPRYRLEDLNNLLDGVTSDYSEVSDGIH
jgi:hypothetical protein